jgi:hypothetical protein
LSEDGPLRRLLYQRQPIIPRRRLLDLLQGQVGVRGVDSGLESLKEAKKREWRAKGYSESLIRMADDLATEWSVSMSEAFAPPELREAAIKYNFPKGLSVADAWIVKIGEAVKAGKV